MASSIFVKPEDVYDYFEDYIKEYGTDANSEVIAEDLDNDVSILLTESFDGSPFFEVWSEGDCIFDATALSAEECEELALMIYMNYIDDYYVQILHENTEEVENDIGIRNNEEELDLAVEEFLSVVCPQFGYNEDELEDIKDHFLEYLARKYDCEIHRPMYLEDENGEDFYTEYPYRQMLFDDPDNPVYKKV